MEPLEARSLLAVITVTRLDDTAGTGDGVTLREALVLANGNAGADTITFAPSLDGQTITLDQGELLVSDSVTIQGPGADKLSISGGSGATRSRVFNFSGGGANTYNLSGLTVKDGNGVGVSTGFGGAIRFVGADDRLLISSAVIRDSSALTGSVEGGGLFADAGTIDLTNVTIVNNTASFGGGLALLEVSAALTNVTISGNSASTRGGGLVQFASRANASSQLRVINSTITGNISPTGAGIRNSTQNSGVASTLSLGNTIVANNTGGGTQLSNTGTGATIVSLGNNIASDASGNLTQPGDQQSADPKLGPLTDSGTGIPTHALLFVSPAIDAGNNALAKTVGPDGIFGNGDDAPLTVDQRGNARLIDGSGDGVATVDVGAVEFDPPTHAPTCVIAAAPQNITDNQDPQSVPVWVINCSPNDPGQNITSISLLADKPELFTSPPSIDTSGTLKFDPAPNVEGTASVTVTVKDDGGTADGGIDTSIAVRSFVITKPHRWHNEMPPVAPVDRGGMEVVYEDDAHSITPTDVLLIINYLNSGLPTRIPASATIADGIGQPFLDVDADDSVTPTDALLIINVLNAGQGGPAGGEGEASTGGAEADPGDSNSALAQLISLFALDASERESRQRSW